MERRRKMDTARLAAAERPLIQVVAILLLLACGWPVLGQAAPPSDPQLEHVRQLFNEQRWQEIVRVVAGSPAPSADLEYYYGTALARLGHWKESRQAFQAGRRLQPADKRFPLELAGVAFQQKDYKESTQYLRQALKFDPRDTYANDFLGSTYFLQGNLEAALKYWNRGGKPRLEQFRSEPVPEVNPELLDRTFAFAPAATLRLPELLTTEMRVRGLEIFPSYRFDLQAREDGAFDMMFRNRERNGWGRNKWEALLRTFGGLPFQNVTPEFYNLQHRAINFVSMFRWDAEKRRVLTSLSGPIRQDPKWRYRVAVDWRNENWDIRNSFAGAAPLAGALNLRKESAGAGVTSLVSGRWNWSTGFELSHRDYRGVFQGSALTPEVLLRGFQLKHLAQFNGDVWRVPERRLVTTAGVFSQVARIWSQPGSSFAKLQISVESRWFPQAQGDDYEMQARIRSGKTFGRVPFDELFMLGLERDNDLWLRGHLGVRDGRKGSAPLGRDYFLANWEADKNICGNGLFTLKLGPFLDTGKITDPSPGLGARKWLWDTGVQAKVRALGVGVIFSYGKDLRSGNNAYYVTVGR